MKFIERWRARWEELDRRVELMDLSVDLKKKDEEIKKLQREIASLRTDFLALKRDFEETIPVDTSVATVMTGVMLALIAIGWLVSWKVSEEQAYDYSAYVFPVFAAWAVGLGLYQRRWIFRAFKSSVFFLSAGLVFYFLSKKLGPAVLYQGIGWIAIVCASVLLFTKPKLGEPPRSRRLIAMYRCLFGLSFLTFLWWGWTFWPEPNESIMNTWHYTKRTLFSRFPSINKKAKTWSTVSAVPADSCGPFSLSGVGEWHIVALHLRSDLSASSPGPRISGIYWPTSQIRWVCQISSPGILAPSSQSYPVLRYSE